jgi:hypothetical protein
MLSSDECLMLDGKLTDPYTGAAFTAKTSSINDLSIDHVVPLSDCWQKGA